MEIKANDLCRIMVTGVTILFFGIRMWMIFCKIIYERVLFDDLVKSHQNDGEECSVPAGTLQQFTLLDLLQNYFRPWRSASLLAIPKCEVSYLTGQG